MQSGRLIVVLALCLLTAACHRDDISVVGDPVGRVILSASTVELTPGGSAEIEFRLEGAEPGPVELRLRDGGVPEEFSAGDAVKGDALGAYKVSIYDSGASGVYSLEVCLVAGASASDYVCVNCGQTSFPPAPVTGLPVVFIDTDGGRPLVVKGLEVEAVLKITGAGGYDGLGSHSCLLRGRGNTSWNWDKKPYRVEFRDRVPVLGMPAHGRWVLLAGFPDRTMMRNLVAMKVSSLTSLRWTPRCVPVELVLNGKHVGNYLLAEQVEVDPCRLDLADGGFLLESDFHFDNERQWMDPHGLSRYSIGIPFAVRYPGPDELSDEAFESVKQYVADAADALYSEGFADPFSGYAKWLDVDSFVDYWLVFEILGNPELSNPASVFFHKDAGGKLTAGPCWDFDCCLRQLGTSVQEKAGILNRYGIWYFRLFRDPAFERRVRERFLELLPALETVPGFIDECRRLLEESAELNFAIWNPAEDRWQNKGLLINGDEKMGFGEAVARLREVYLQRLELLKKNI